MHDSAFHTWMAGANRYALLSPSEELILAGSVRTMLDSPAPTKGQIRAGQRAKQKLINCNLRLAAKAVQSFSRQIKAKGGELEDALQESIIGLNRAAERFDPARGYKFSTYAMLWLQQAIRRYIQVSCGTIKIPNAAQDVERRWMYRPYGQTMDAFCEEWGYQADWVIRELQYHQRARVTSLDQPCGGDIERSSLLELIEDPTQTMDAADLDRVYAIEQLEKVCPQEFELVMAEASGASPMAISTLAGVKRGKATREALSDARESLQHAYHALPAITNGSQIRQNVATPCHLQLVPTMNGNGLAALEALVDEVQAEPAAPVKQRRARRTRAQIEADRAAMGLPVKAAKAAPAGVVKLVIGGVPVEAAVADAAQLLKALAA